MYPAAQRKKRNRRIFLAALLLVFAVLAGACAWYLGTYYRADTAAIEAFSAEYSVAESVGENGDLTFGTGREELGFIFYPGGKVSHESYAPLMRELASNGVFCVICKMPFRLAVFEENAAAGIREAYPEIRRWLIGGHSLGGVMAASYLSRGAEHYDGLILLASYSSKDLSGTDLKVLSVYGSEDRVLNRLSYERNRGNLPADMRELVIEGGCHAGFGMYGPQRGDGEPTVSASEQIHRTAAAILEILNGTGR